MRKIKISKTGVAVFFFFSIHLFHSCQKESTPKMPKLPNQIESIVSKWLNDLRPGGNAGKIKWVTNLKQGIDYTRAYSQEAGADKLIVVPLKESFESKFNPNKDMSSFLVLRATGANIIKRANIVLFKPGNGSDALTPAAFSRMYLDGDKAIDGAFTLLGTWDKHLFNAVFKDKAVSTVTTYEKKVTANTAAARTDCTGWYLVTRYYDQYGNLTHTDEVLMWIDCSGTNCSPGDPNCTDASDSSDPDNPGGGGGGASGGGDGTDCEAMAAGINFRSVSEKIRVTICGTGTNTRTKCYEWKAYSVSGGLLPMYFMSVETGVQVFNSKYWAFKSFTHKELVKRGVEILYTASASNVTATPTLKKSGVTYYNLAQMHLMFPVKVSLICSELPIAVNDFANTQCQWLVNE